MKPKSFKGKTIEFTAPPQVGDRQIEKLPAAQVNGEIVSCWHIGFFTALKLIFTRTLWIGLLSDGQPPMYLSTNRPFTLEDAQKVLDKIEAKEQFKKLMSEKYGKEASAKVERLIKGGIKKGDPRWNFSIEPEEYEKAVAYDIGSIMGLKILCRVLTRISDAKIKLFSDKNTETIYKREQ